MKTAIKLLVVLCCALFATSAFANWVKFRVPLSLLDTHCGNGRCAPSAYFDTNRSWGYYRDYACGIKTYNQHDGIDYAIGGFWAMDQGRWVMAAASGTVIETHDGEFDRCTTANCGTANYVKIRHADGKVTVYWHLKKWSVRVRPGQWVGCGTVIGNVGSSGYSTGPHLHFGVVVPCHGADDPYGASNSACGGGFSYWVNQGAYLKLPGLTCQ